MPAETQPHIKPGLWAAALLMGLTLFFYFTRVKASGELQMALRVLLVAGCVALAAYRYSRVQPGLGVKEVFFFGFRVTTIIALCSIAFGLLFIGLVPAFKNEAVATFRAEQLQPVDGKIPQLAAVEAEVADYKKRFLTLFIGMNMMIVVLSGFIGSLAGALVRRKN